MHIYSRKIAQFILQIKKSAAMILSQEVGLKVTRNHFYNKEQTTSYPISIVVFNHRSMLGYFDPNFLELGFHESLMYSPKELLNIIRHEIAHYLTFIDHPYAYAPHGAEFKSCCLCYGWGEEISRASFCIESEAQSEIEDESSVLRKIKKLMALSTSSNQNEAEQALIKSQQLLLKHNLDAEQIPLDEDGEKMYLKRILKQKKENAKMRSIANILESFFVNVVYSRHDGHIYLEILGSLVNIQIAEYVAGVLEYELDRLWIDTQSRFPHLKGMVAKNSFFLGVSRGYRTKMGHLKKEYNQTTLNSLMVLEDKLAEAQSLAYGRLQSSSSKGGYCPHASNLGEKAGKQLQIHAGISQNQKAGVAGYLEGVDRL